MSSLSFGSIRGVASRLFRIGEQMKETDLLNELRQLDVPLKRGQTLQDVRFFLVLLDFHANVKSTEMSVSDKMSARNRVCVCVFVFVLVLVWSCLFVCFCVSICVCCLMHTEHLQVCSEIGHITGTCFAQGADVH